MGRKFSENASIFATVIRGLLIAASLTRTVLGILAFVIAGVILIALAVLFVAFVGPVLQAMGWQSSVKAVQVIPTGTQSAKDSLVDV